MKIPLLKWTVALIYQMVMVPLTKHSKAMMLFRMHQVTEAIVKTLRIIIVSLITRQVVVVITIQQIDDTTNCNDCHTNDINSIASDPLFCECEGMCHKDCSFPFCACREHDFDSASETSEGIQFNQQKCACDAEHVKCQNPRCSCEDHLLDNENYEKALQPMSLSEVNKNAKCVYGAGSRCKSCQDPLFKNMILFFKLDSAKQAALDKLNLSCTRY